MFICSEVQICSQRHPFMLHLEQFFVPGSGEEEKGHVHALPPAIPTWFLSAVAPAGLPSTGQPGDVSPSQVQVQHKCLAEHRADDG